MIHSQYCRLGVHVSASNRVVIRAAFGMLSTAGRGRTLRQSRHQWLRLILAEHQASRRVFEMVR